MLVGYKSRVLKKVSVREKKRECFAILKSDGI